GGPRGDARSRRDSGRRHAPDSARPRSRGDAPRHAAAGRVAADRSAERSQRRGVTAAPRWRKGTNGPRRIRGPFVPCPRTAYLHAGSPAAADAPTVGFVVLMPRPQVMPGSCVWFTVAVQKPAPVTIVGAFTPVEFWNFSCVSVVVYFELSAKNASSAVTRL